MAHRRRSSSDNIIVERVGHLHGAHEETPSHRVEQGKEPNDDGIVPVPPSIYVHCDVIKEGDVQEIRIPASTSAGEIIKKALSTYNLEKRWENYCLAFVKGLKKSRSFRSASSKPRVLVSHDCPLLLGLHQLTGRVSLYVVGNVPGSVRMPVLGKADGSVRGLSPARSNSSPLPEAKRYGIPEGVPFLMLSSEKYEILHPFHKLAQGINLVGSVNPESFKDLQLPGKSIRPKHCAFVVDDNVTLIAFPDCAVLLNDQKMTKPSVLADGAIIVIGKHTMKFHRNLASKAHTDSPADRLHEITSTGLETRADSYARSIKIRPGLGKHVDTVVEDDSSTTQGSPPSNPQPLLNRHLSHVVREKEGMGSTHSLTALDSNPSNTVNKWRPSISQPVRVESSPNPPVPDPASKPRNMSVGASMLRESNSASKLAHEDSTAQSDRRTSRDKWSSRPSQTAPSKLDQSGTWEKWRSDVLTWVATAQPSTTSETGSDLAQDAEKPHEATRQHSRQELDLMILKKQTRPVEAVLTYVAQQSNSVPDQPPSPEVHSPSTKLYKSQSLDHHAATPKTSPITRQVQAPVNPPVVLDSQISNYSLVSGISYAESVSTIEPGRYSPDIDPSMLSESLKDLLVNVKPSTLLRGSASNPSSRQEPPRPAPDIIISKTQELSRDSLETAGDGEGLSPPVSPLKKSRSLRGKPKLEVVNSTTL